MNGSFKKSIWPGPFDPFRGHFQAQSRGTLLSTSRGGDRRSGYGLAPTSEYSTGRFASWWASRPSFTVDLARAGSDGGLGS